MPRDLGKAGRQDLTGRLPGEEREFVSGMVRFLEGAGQLAPPRPGSYRDKGGNGRDTEIPSRGNGRSKRTESLRADSDTLFDEPLMIDDINEALLAPDSAEEMPQQPDRSPVEELYNVPELMSPELEVHGDEETDTAPARNRRGMPTLKPEPHELPPSHETGLLEMAAGPMDADALDDVDDETGLIPQGDEDNRITSKVDPRSETDPRWRDHQPMRDTVNFYNQTQSLSGKPSKSFPTISPSEVSGRHPLDLSPEDLPEPVGELQSLEPVPGEDTQRYPEQRRDPHAAPKPPASSESTSLELAQSASPPGRGLGGSGDTAGDFTNAKTTPLKKREKPAPLPQPSEVRADFTPSPPELPSDRIVPELAMPDEDEPETPFFEQELVPESGVERITEKVGKQIDAAIAVDAALPETAPLPPRDKPATKRSAAPPKPPKQESVPRITDALARRIREEREETLRLIRQAEEVAARLRAAGEQSRRHLAALSVRRIASAPNPASETVTDAQTSTQTGQETESFEAAELEMAETVFETIQAPVAHEETTPFADPVTQPPGSQRTTRRQAAQGVDDIVERIEQKLSGPASLREVILQVSRRLEHTRQGADSPADHDFLDFDEMVAASAALRETVEAEADEDRRSGMHEAVEEPPVPVTGRLQAIWQEVDSLYEQPVIEEGVRSPGSPAPAGGLGWTQEPLWKMLLALGGVTLLLAGAFGVAVRHFLQR